MNVSPVFAGPFSCRSPRICSLVRFFSVSTENTVQNTSIPHKRLEGRGREGGGRKGGRGEEGREGGGREGGGRR